MSRTRENHWLRRIKLPHVALAAAAIAVLLPFGCLGQNGAGDGPSADSLLCVDDDGDGFGKGCAKGLDCDDTNASIGDECYKCQTPSPGCPCSTEGERSLCGKVDIKIGEQVVCGQGDSVCTNGAWGECIINNTISLAPQMPGGKPQTLGPATKCLNNPCDPSCTTFNDTPTGLTDLDAGIVVADAGDAGITLPGSVPPAPITCMGGVDGTCAHTMCTVGTKLTAGCDVPSPPAPGVQEPPELVFLETFHNNAQGWTETANSEWQIAVAATAGSGSNLASGFNDPGSDHTTGQLAGDNKIAGFSIGTDFYGTKGIAKISVTHPAHYLTSPPLNTDGSWGSPVTLSFWRFLNSDLPTKTLHTVDVCNGASCVNLYSNASTVKDSAWTQVSYVIPAASVQQNMTIRFGMQVLATNGSKVSSWNIDDVTITKTPPAPPPVPAPPASCVAKVCAANVMPSCCTGAWTIDCVKQIFPTCGVSCGSLNGVCVTCWSDTYDHDGDGYTGAQGDCADCDPTINPNAYDFPGDFIDQDCTGAADDATESCDGALAVASTNPYDFAKAMELCKTTTVTSKDWGVITPGAKFVQADVDLELGTGALPPAALQYGIITKFGTNNPPKKGSQMAIFSSGTAREPYAAGWVNPNGNGYQVNSDVTMPSQFPKTKAGCALNSATSARDSSGLWMAIRAPSNAKSFSFKFNMFSAEYPEWVCTNFNDTFIARLLTGYLPANPVANGNNISFDANNNPVTINVGFFTVPGSPTGSSPLLTGTNMDGMCNSQTCGGGTDWLYTTAPIIPNEIIKMNFEIWDEGDSKYDSFVLVDDWLWSVETTSIQTGKVPPGQPVIYSDGYFVRDYNLTGVCPQGTRVVWGLWSWAATTASTSYIDFKVQTADTQAGLAAAPSDALQFSNPPGPVGLVGQPVVAKTGPPSTVSGSAVVETTLLANNRPINLPFLRVTSHLAPSADKLNPPVLNAWNLSTSCVASE